MSAAVVAPTTPELAPALTALRLSLRVLAAAIWVGGQLVVAGAVPILSRSGSGLAEAVGSRFARLAWPAFAVLVATGIWNVLAVGVARAGTAWTVVLWAKVAAVAVAGASAGLHQRARSRSARAILGAVSAISALAALVLGVLLAG